jgi:hypothetical protein
MICAINVRVPMVRTRAHRQRANRASVVASALQFWALGAIARGWQSNSAIAPMQPFTRCFGNAAHRIATAALGTSPRRPDGSVSSRHLAALVLPWYDWSQRQGPHGLASCRLNVVPTNHGPPPSTPQAPRFRDARVTCSRHRKPSPPVLSLAADESHFLITG